jgi:hypothetical protein
VDSEVQLPHRSRRRRDQLARAEQALRLAVVNRKVAGGNRTAHGAASQQILTSVVQAARLRGLSPRHFLVDFLHAPTLSAALSLN